MFTLLGKVSVANRIRLLMVISLLGMLAIAVFGLSTLSRELHEERRASVKASVEIAHGVAAHFGTLQKSGQLTMEQAQEQAAQAISALLYDDGNYFWVNDSDAKMIMHPIKPELNGKDVSSFRDSNGVQLFVETTRIAQSKGDGFLAYQWPRPGESDPVAKMSYVKNYQPWGWIIGSGVYLDDIKQAFWSMFFSFALVFALILVAMFFATAVIGNSISSPLKRLCEVMQDVKSSGNIGLCAQISQGAELGGIGMAFDNMLSELNTFVADINQSSCQLANAATELATVSAQTNSNIDQQKSQTMQVATAMTEMSATVSEIANSSTNTADATQKADAFSDEGQEVVNATMAAIDKLAFSIGNTNEVVERLASNTESVGTVLDVIRGVAEQTNLLALNAAIEAARAGEQGRGFAVVADEVRHLAQRTQDSTQEIQSIIGNVQAGAAEVVSAMASGLEQAELSVQCARDAKEKLQNINGMVDHISDMTAQIATASEEQSAVADEVSRNINDINMASEQNAAGVGQTAAASRELSMLAESLQLIAGRYKAA